MAGRLVLIPWPISACDTIKVTLLSGVTRTQAVSGTPPGPDPVAVPSPIVAPSAGDPYPSNNPPPATAALHRKARRDRPSVEATAGEGSTKRIQSLSPVPGSYDVSRFCAPSPESLLAVM